MVQPQAAAPGISMPGNDAVTRRFAAFAAGLTYDALPPVVREHLTIFLLDYLRVASLGQRYLNRDHPPLLHGDLFLGSLLRAEDGKILLIDPEFSFGGEPEFDLGVFYAHLILSGHDSALLDRWLTKTVSPGRGAALVRHYAGVELMRRLIGVAQLPLPVDLAAKRALIDVSRTLVAS